MKTNELVLSPLGHTWIFDLDGTLVKHNGYLLDGHDTLLPGALEFLQTIPEKDMVIILTSREEKYRKMTESFLHKNRIRYNCILFHAPFGERILVNDDKPSGLRSSYAIRTQRDCWCELSYCEDQNL